MTPEEKLIWDRYWKVTIPQGKYDCGNSYHSSILNQIHRKHLVATFGHSGDRFPLPMKIQSADFLSAYDRTVIGNHGAYIEFDPGHSKLAFVTKSGEEWRLQSPHAKYHWLHPVIDGIQIPIKIYHQTRTVTYADYLPGKMYVSPYELFGVSPVDYGDDTKPVINLF